MTNGVMLVSDLFKAAVPVLLLEMVAPAQAGPEHASSMLGGCLRLAQTPSLLDDIAGLVEAGADDFIELFRVLVPADTREQ